MVEIGQRNVEIARKAYKAFEEGDVQTVMEVFADDIVWHVPGKSSIAGTYKGKQQVMELFGKYMGMYDGQETELHDVLANDQHTVALLTVKYRKQGRTLEMKATDITHPDSEGRIKEFWRISEDVGALDEFLDS
ncbi:MAG TPA: nuclear transport factor 2 family protein [Candidatus Dormibacteraeota bacterium]